MERPAGSHVLLQRLACKTEDIHGGFVLGTVVYLVHSQPRAWLRFRALTSVGYVLGFKEHRQLKCQQDTQKARREPTTTETPVPR